MQLKRNIFLHIGTMKTGTTSIQNSLNKNSGKLEGSGVHFAQGLHRKFSQFEDSALTAKQKNCSLLISDEGIWHFLISPTKKQELLALRELFSNFLAGTGNLNFIIYFRRPDDFLQSWYFQGLKLGTGNPLFAEFKKSAFVKAGVDYLGKLKLIEGIFPHAQIIVRPYAKSQLKNANSVDDFFESVGFDDLENIVNFSDKNVSKKEVEYYLTRAMLLFAAKELEFDLNLDNVLKRIRHAEEKLNIPKQNRVIHSLWSSDDISELYAHYIPVFKEIALRYAPDGPIDFFEQWQPRGNSENLPNIFKAFLKLDSTVGNQIFMDR